MFTDLDVAKALPDRIMLSIDPGSVNFGVCVAVVDSVNKKFIPKFITTVKVDRLVGPYLNWINRADIQTLKMVALADYIEKLVNEQNPTIVVCENCYLARHVSAFKALTKVTTTIHQTVFRINPFIPFVLTEASVVKNGLGVKGGSSDKNEMKAAALKGLPYMDLTNVDLDSLDEHSIDSMAVGYSFVKSVWG